MWPGISVADSIIPMTLKYQPMVMYMFGQCFVGIMDPLHSDRKLLKEDIIRPRWACSVMSA